MASRYNYSLTTFSQKGGLTQIEYAMNAVSKGGLSVGIKTDSGVVIASEKKKQTPMIVQSSVEKIFAVSPSIGMAYSGLGPDARVLLDSIRKTVQKHKMLYGGQEPSPVDLVQDIAETMQEYTQRGGVRPFGVSVLIAGIDCETKEPMLYQADPSGSYTPWKACALGNNSEKITTLLEKRLRPDMDIEDAVHLAIKALKDGFDGEITDDNIEIGIVSAADRFRKLDAEEIKDHLENIAQN
ncbi:MAG: 20S proteasome component alpha 2, PSMA2 [Amphiamblys sp. WSBS2006]|nr:MAG: 20S proteasome component alpha 2, PSMA2 [Amphiamblys sp. WSBS2006]